MASKCDNNKSISASCTPVSVDDDSPAEIASDPSVLPVTTRHTSAVWIDFKRKRVGDIVKMECNYCLKLFAGGPKAGTTHLKDHSKICQRDYAKIFDNYGCLAQKNVVDDKETLTLAPYEFRQEDGRRDLAKMIILHEYPINMAEHYGFRKFSKTLQPGFKVPSRNTTRKDIMQRYESEKENITTLLRKTKSRIALTTNMWTASNQRKGYMALIDHFIDNSWKLESRIIRSLYVPAPHTAEVLADAMKQCIQSWYLDLRLSSITVDNCTTNDAMMEILKEAFLYGSLLMQGMVDSKLVVANNLLILVVTTNQTIMEMCSCKSLKNFWRNQSHEKSDLDKYLEDANAPLVDNFDILNWWKTNGGSYPILQQVARDILSIPVSTVPFESSFNTSGRVLEPHRSRLLPETLEALMCAQNWIWASLKGAREFKEKEFAKLVEELEEESEITDLGANNKLYTD